MQVTCCWDGHRTKFGIGQKCLPKHWDAKRERVKEKPDSYATDINQVLDDYVSAAQATYRAAQGQPLTKEAAARRHRAAPGRPGSRAHRPGGAAPVPAPALTFLDYFDQWIADESQKISVRTGRKLTKDTIWTHGAVRRELADFATHRQQPIAFAGLNKAFYDGLRNYMLGPAGRSPRTFNTCIKRLRSFLFWAESQELLVPPLFRKTLKLAPSYVGKDALTQELLLRVAAIDFAAPACRPIWLTPSPSRPPKLLAAAAAMC